MLGLFVLGHRMLRPVVQWSVDYNVLCNIMLFSSLSSYELLSYCKPCLDMFSFLQHILLWSIVLGHDFAIICSRIYRFKIYWVGTCLVTAFLITICRAFTSCAETCDATRIEFVHDCTLQQPWAGTCARAICVATVGDAATFLVTICCAITSWPTTCCAITSWA